MTHLTFRLGLHALVCATFAFGAPLGDAAAAGRIGVESASAAAYSPRLTLGVGRAIIVDLPAEASEIIVGDPKVANAVVRSTRKIFVMGVSTGQTTIIALDKAGGQIANIEMNVGRDLSELSKLIQAALPKSNIQVRQINYSLILSGEVDSAGDAALALDMAKAFASSTSGGAGGAGSGSGGASTTAADGSVVSTITIRGRDQVMVKVTIAEVQRNILKQLGVSANPTTPDTLLKAGWATFTQQNPFTLNGSLTNGGLTVPLSSTTALNLQAFERYGVSRVLAEPTVTAVSGETAKFTAGGEIPVPQNSTCTPSVVPGVQPVCTVGIAFKQYGVTLNMTPVVLSGGAHPASPGDRGDGDRPNPDGDDRQHRRPGVPDTQERDLCRTAVRRVHGDRRSHHQQLAAGDQRNAGPHQPADPRLTVPFA